MSDALLIQISKQLGEIHATLKVGGAPATPTPTVGKTPATTAAPKPAAGAAAPDAAAKAAAAKADDVAKKAATAAAEKAAAAKAAAAKTPAGPATGTKAPGGRYTVDQVRDKVREVATNASLGRDSAKDILDQDGGGVKSVKDLKPENYDKVYEACQVALQSEGSAPAAAPAPEDDLM
jgi:nucleoid-associated protein YgaU